MQKMPKHKWDASDYAVNSSAQAKWGKELIAKLNLRGDETVLDIGCGDGKLTVTLAQQLPSGSVQGIDSSLEMIRFAVKSFPSLATPNLSFKVCDACRLTSANKFDVVVSFACLHWIKDHLPVLKSIRRSLKNNGRILLQFGGKGNAEDLLAVTDEVIAGDQWKKYFRRFVFPWHFYEPGQYRVWVKQAGLTPKRVELIAKDMVQKSKDDLIGWIRATWRPYVCRVPAGLQNKFLTEIVQRYLARYPLDEDGCAHLQMQRLEVEAYKTVIGRKK
jgi:trans-aconitate methyltransferase